MPPHDGGKLWRKKRQGREYGSWHTYAGGKIVNLATDVLDDAKAAAAKLMGGAAPFPRGPRMPVVGAAPPASRPFLREWATGGGVTPIAPAAPPPLPPPAAPGMSPEIATALASAFAAGATAMYITAISLGVRYLGHRRPPEATALERKDIGATMEIALADLFRRTEIKPWHVLVVQGGSMAVRMMGEGQRLNTGAAGDVQPNREQAAHAEAA